MKRFLLLCVTVILAGLAISGASAQSLSAKKALLIIPSANFQDDEFAQPLGLLKNQGVIVTVASTTLDEVTGMNGAKTKPDVLLKEVSVEGFDAIVFIGGSGAMEYVDDPLAHTIAREAIAKNKIVGGICLAPRILASAGVLKDKKATVYPTEGDKLKACGVNYTAKPVERDGNVITADGPGSAVAFGEALVAALKEVAP